MSCRLRSPHYTARRRNETNKNGSCVRVDRKLKRNEIAERKYHSTRGSPHTAMLANVGDIISLARALRRRRSMIKREQWRADISAAADQASSYAESEQRTDKYRMIERVTRTRHSSVRSQLQDTHRGTGCRLYGPIFDWASSIISKKTSYPDLYSVTLSHFR